MFLDHPWMGTALFAMFFVVLWLAISYGISHQIGWAALAKCYRSSQLFQGIRVHVRHAQFARSLFGGVNNGINIGVNADGIEIRMVFLFRLNCPNLFMPWTDIKISRGKFWYMQYVDLEFSKVPGSSVRVFGKAAQRMQEAAGTAWPERLPP